jgi:CUB/sushi domain-containing protein
MCKPVKCKEPHNIVHGHIDYDPNNLYFNAKINYNCNLGYELTGPSMRVCGEKGLWIGEEPECVIGRCLPPKTPIHGKQDINDLTVGGTVSFGCNHGYKMEGSKVLTCLSNKTWSDAAPHCTKIGCRLPENIIHGYVRYSKTDYQSNIEYYCDPGYSLVGMRTRSCLRSAQWSGEAPSCVPSVCPSLGKSLRNRYLGTILSK